MGQIEDTVGLLKLLEDKMANAVLNRMLTKSGINGGQALHPAMNSKSKSDFGNLLDLIKEGKAVSGENSVGKMRSLVEYRDQLKEVGMTQCLMQVEKQIEVVNKRQELLDYKYIVITQKQIDTFMRRISGGSIYDRREWHERTLDSSSHLPPPKVVEAIKIHQDRKVFDYLTIACVLNVPDPIVFGRLNDSDDRFFIAQWGEDVCLDDLI